MPCTCISLTRLLYSDSFKSIPRLKAQQTPRSVMTGVNISEQLTCVNIGEAYCMTYNVCTILYVLCCMYNYESSWPASLATSIFSASGQSLVSSGRRSREGLSARGGGNGFGMFEKTPPATLRHCTMGLSPLKRCIKEFWQNVSFSSHFPAV